MPRPRADLVVVNADVITVDPEHPAAGALAVSDGRFLAVGASAEMLDLAGPGTEVVDAHGKTVIPGLIDAHAHLELMAYSWDISVDCRSPRVRSIGDIVAQLREKAATTQPGQWIFGQGNHFQDAMLEEDRYPDRHDLDLVSTSHPVVFRSSYHFNVFNSTALGMLHVTSATPDAPGGRIERDPSTGEPTGRTFDMYDALGAPEAPFEDLVVGVARAQARYLAVGVTAVGDIPLLPGGLRALLELGRRQQLVLRVTAYPKLPTVASLAQATDGELAAEFAELDPAWLKLGGIKLFLDGGLTSSAAALYEPYEDLPGYRGELAFSQDELDALVTAISAAGHQVAIHAIGDRALDSAITALADLPADQRDPRRPHRIEHGGNLFMTPERIARLRESSILPVPQPSFIHTTAPGYRRQLGPERSRKMMPFRTLLDAGLRLPGNSDAIGMTARQHDPWFGIWAAVCRVAVDNELVDPDEAITTAEALRMYTRDAAYSLGSEADIGSIETGKRADFVVLGANPLTARPEHLCEVGVEQTWVGGKPAFTREHATTHAERKVG